MSAQKKETDRRSDPFQPKANKAMNNALTHQYYITANRRLSMVRRKKAR